MDKRFLTLTISFVLISCSEAPDSHESSNEIPSEVSVEIQRNLESFRNDGTLQEGWYPNVTKVDSGSTKVYIVEYNTESLNENADHGSNGCGTAGCLLDVFVDSRGSVNRIWSNNVLGYNFQNPNDGTVSFDFNMRSWSCKNGGDGFECTVKFKFDGNRMINTDGNFTES